MKKIYLTIIFSATLGISLFAGNTITSTKLAEESLINDIPFNTAEIYKSEMLNKKVNNLKLNDEHLVDDIPFNTEKIFTVSQIEKSSKLVLKEEELVNDIPFNTAEVVKRNRK